MKARAAQNTEILQTDNLIRDNLTLQCHNFNLEIKVMNCGFSSEVKHINNLFLLSIPGVIDELAARGRTELTFHFQSPETEKP